MLVVDRRITLTSRELLQSLAIWNQLHPSTGSTRSTLLTGERSASSFSQAALPLLGFSKQSWVLGFFSEDLGFFLGFSKGPWVFLGFFKISPKIHFFCCFLQKVSKTFLAKNGQN